MVNTRVQHKPFPASAETMEYRVFHAQATADANVNQTDQHKKSHHVTLSVLGKLVIFGQEL